MENPSSKNTGRRHGALRKEGYGEGKPLQHALPLYLGIHRRAILTLSSLSSRFRATGHCRDLVTIVPDYSLFPQIKNSLKREVIRFISNYFCRGEA
jgi:hypothetical protein